MARQWSISEIVKTLVAVASMLVVVVGFVWGLGKTDEKVRTNTRDIAETKSDVKAVDDRVRNLSSEMATLTEAVKSLNATLRDLRSNPTDTSTVGRVFDVDVPFHPVLDIEGFVIEPIMRLDGALLGNAPDGRSFVMRPGEDWQEISEKEVVFGELNDMERATVLVPAFYIDDLSDIPIPNTKD